jgi:hypothetical protein
MVYDRDRVLTCSDNRKELPGIGVDIAYGADGELWLVIHLHDTLAI